MDNVKVRQAFALAIDREALAKFRKTLKPFVDMTPEGIFPKYEEAREKVYTEELKKQGSSLEEWKAPDFQCRKGPAAYGGSRLSRSKGRKRLVMPVVPRRQGEHYL